MTKSIAIDATHYAAEQPTGVELYVDRLLPALSAELARRGAAVSWIRHAPLDAVPQGVTVVRSEHYPAWSQWILPRLLDSMKADIFFTPSGIPPLVSSVPVAMTVHDITVYEQPESYSFAARARLARAVPLAARRAKVVLTPSAFVKEEVERRWKLDPARVTVTPLALPEEGGTAEEAVILPFGLPYALFVSRVERKKNLDPLIRAIAEIPSLALVVAGSDGYGADEIKAAVQQLPDEARSRVFFPGYVSEGQKKWLYANARVAAVPGMGEGFGIPLLEAFAAGIPAVASASGSLPEVAGTGAVLVAGDDVEEWRRGLLLAADDEAMRAKLIEAGSARLGDFSWERCAELTADALLAAI